MNTERVNPTHIGRTILIGFFTVAPLWVTWLVFDFLLGILAGMGTPLLRAAARMVMPFSETLAVWLLDSDFQVLDTGSMNCLKIMLPLW